LNTPTNSRIRPILITSLVAGLAAGLGGCSSSGTQKAGSGAFQPEGLAKFSTQEIAPDATTGNWTSEHYQAEATEIALPDQWLSEAEFATASIESRRAAAEAAKVKAAAEARERQAAAEAALSGAFSQMQAEVAGADRTANVYDARIAEQRAQIDARQHAFQAEGRRREAFLAASISEWQAEVERMRSSAEAAWNDSVARHEQLIAERAAVETRGQATIDKMVQVAELTAQRASEKVAALRTEAQSTTAATNATVSEIGSTIQSVREQTAARVTELRQQGESLREETFSTVAELNAEADALAQQDIQGEYSMSLQQAQVSFESALAEASDLRAMAIERRTAAAAEMNRRFAELETSETTTRAAYDEAIDNIEATLENAQAVIAVQRAEAEKIEKTARARFVQAEVDARVAAIIEESTHQSELAEDEFEKVREAAQAEAAQLQAKLYRQIAKERKSKKVTLSPEAEANPDKPTNDAGTPTFSDAGAKAPVVAPDRIAQFKTELAKASKFRVQADAEEAKAIATHDAETASFNAWLESAGADHEAWHARIGAFGRQADAEVSTILSKAESVVAEAEARRDRAFVFAESDKQSTMARVASLNAKASALEKKNLARAEQLFAQADTTARNGDSEVRTLEIRRDSTLRRGNARSRSLLVEADSLEQSQRAVVAQMTGEIDAARRILSSEIARLDQSASTYLAVAEANYEENKVLADTFERVSVANTTELTSAHVTANKQAMADVEYLARVADANEISAGAEIDRMVADASAKLSIQEASDIAHRANIEARERIARAAAAEQIAVANAEEQVVRSRFDSRIAATIASRDNAYADLYLDGFRDQARSRQAFADAARYEELAGAALDRLNAAARSFGRTADENWDSRLALPASFAKPFNTDALYRKASDKLNEGFFVNVEVD
jgi:hypothetical protein